MAFLGVITQPNHAGLDVLHPLNHHIQVKSHNRLDSDHLQGVLNLEKILIPLGRWWGSGNSFTEFVPIGLNSCAQDDISREAGPVEGLGQLWGLGSGKMA